MDGDHDLPRRFTDTGDNTAFLTVVERHGDLVRTVARRVTGNAADADDVAQEVIVELARPASRIQEPVSAWLRRDDTNRARDARRLHSARWRAARRCPNPPRNR